MRILHVIPQFPWVGGRTVIGGHASSVLTTALAQTGAGHDVSILSFVQGHAGSFRIEDLLEVHNPFDRARPGTIRYGLRFCNEAARWAGSRRDEFDVVHGHSGFADYLLATDAVRGATSRPALHTLYCPIPPRGRWHLPLVRGRIRRAGRRIDRLVAMSRNVARSMTAFGLPEPVIVAPPVDLQRFHPGSNGAATRERLGLGAGDVAVLFVGNAKPQKNLAGLLRAFHAVAARHASARLVITTELEQSASDAQLAELRRQVDELGLRDRIVQLGIIDDMPELMRTCDVLVAPFLDTKGPSDYFMAVLEAMACGKPTIVSAVGGMPEVIDEQHGRLIDPADDQTLIDALDELLADADARRAAGALARSYTESHFDPALIVDRYGALYDAIT